MKTPNKRIKWREWPSHSELKLQILAGSKEPFKMKSHFPEQNRIPCSFPSCKPSKTTDIGVWIEDENGEKKKHIWRCGSGFLDKHHILLVCKETDVIEECYSIAFVVPKEVSTFEEAVEFLKKSPDLLRQVVHNNRFVHNEEFEDELTFDNLTRTRYNYGLELTFVKGHYTYHKRLNLEFLNLFE